MSRPTEPPARHAPARRLMVVAHDVNGRGGMERVLVEVIRRLAGDWDISVLSITLDSSLDDLVTWHRVRVPIRPAPLRFVCFFVLAGWQLRSIKRNGGLVLSCGAIVPNRVDVASVHLCHAGVIKVTGRLAPPDAKPSRRLNTGLQRVLALAAERWCYRPSRVRILHAVSRGLGRELAHHYPGVDIIVVPNGVDGDRFCPDELTRTRVRQLWDVPDEAVVALFVGGDWHRKGLGIAISATSIARSAGADVRLWVVGSGDRPQFSAVARRAGIAQWVSFIGVRTDTEVFYQAADLLVLPSQYETSSLAAHEAAASGLPVVASAVHGVLDLVGNDEAGVIVGLDPLEVSAAVVMLATDREQRRRLGAEGRRRTAALGWDGVAVAMEEALRSLQGAMESAIR